MADIDFPAGLPKPLRQGYGLNHVSPFARTEMATGRARQRRTFTSVPSMATVTWLLDTLQAQTFEAWFRDAITDGADWFNCELKTPIGLRPYECRFADMYDGPTLVGLDHWRYGAELEIRERPILPPGWGLVPDLVQGASIIDVAVNREWPEA